MIEALAFEVSRLEAEQYSQEARSPCYFTLPKPSPYRGSQEQLQILQKGRDTNEDKRVKTIFQNTVMEEQQYEEEDEVHGLEDKGSAPFLTIAAYENELSKGTSHQFFVLVEQQAHQQKQVGADPFILKESEPKASSASNDYVDLQITQPAFFPYRVINKGEEFSPSSYVSLSAQKRIPHSFPLGVEAGHSSILKANTDHFSLDIMKPTQVASTQTEKVTCQMTEEEGAHNWDTSLDVDCSEKNEGADDVSMSPTQEYIGSPFILIVQAIDDKDKYIATIVIQQVYKGSHKEHPRMRVYRKGMKFDPYLPNKVRFPKLFEVEDQINPIFLIFD